MKKTCYIFDLEGTLTDNSHRMHLALNKQWPEYSEQLRNDPPRIEIVTIYRSLQALGFHCVISTGLSRKYVALAHSWLKRFGITPDQLLMRPEENYQASPDVKRHHLESLRKNHTVLAVFEDREKNIVMYKQEGIPCLVIQQPLNY